MSTVTDNVIDLPEDALSEGPAEEDTEPSFDDTPEDSIPGDNGSVVEDEDDDDYIVVIDEAFVPVVDLSRAVPAPVDTWLAFEINLATPKEPGTPYYDPENPQIVLSCTLMTSEYGGRAYPYRMYLDKKPRVFEGARKPSPNKPQVTALQRIVVATGLATQGGQKITWSTLPEQLQDGIFMGQLYHQSPKEREFSFPTAYGNHCALVSPVNGHHFSDLPYDVVVNVTDDMLEDPDYAIHYDDEQNVTVLKPRYDADAVEKAVEKAVQKAADELDSSSLNDDQRAEAIDLEAQFTQRRLTKRVYYNPFRKESSPAGAPFKNEHGDDQKDIRDLTAKFGYDDPIFDDVDGFGQAPGTEIINEFNGTEYTHLAKVPAPAKGEIAQQDPKQLIKSERLSPRVIAPVPNRMLAVKEEGTGAEAHYEVQWHHVGLLAIGDSPAAQDHPVDTLDINTGEVVQLRYGADSQWHPVNEAADERDSEGRKIYEYGTWTWTNNPSNNTWSWVWAGTDES
jgi:hypothetical protein